jgi:glycosyltransferase involved in cell wall biosynthesis
MVIAIGLLAIAVSLELIVSYRWLAGLRKVVAGLAMICLVTAVGSLMVVQYSLGTIIMACIAAYSLVNLGRVIWGKADIRYVQRSVEQTAIWLGIAQVITTYYVLATSYWYIPLAVDVYVIMLVQVVIAVVIVLAVHRQLRTTRLPQSEALSDSKLPTVTVAVPVRNEADQLEACLTSILASNYPKLEVLAFDDHSHDKTPDIIKSFAHAGVRFIRTSELAGGWLAKNQAYDSLAQAANGQYIVFVGADVRLGVRSIRQLVALAESKHKHMVSILPLNRTVERLPLLQAMRYFWEMAPPRRLFNRPPVLSSCWMIDRASLQRYGGFAAARQSMSSEAQLAQSAVADNDSYSFLRADDNLEITSNKAAGEQKSTALLRRYPQAHRRPEIVLLYALGLALFLVGPIVVLVYALIAGPYWIMALLSLVAFVIDVWAFGTVMRPVFPRVAAWRSYTGFLPAVLLDVWYLNASMLRYEFATVTWKDREVSRPVMHSGDDINDIKNTKLGQ